MSFSRIKYDNDSYDLKINRSIAPGDYRLFKGYNESCDKCFSYDGPKNAKSDVSTAGGATNDIEWGDMADVESHLMNRTNILLDSNKYGLNDDYKNFPVKSINNCNSKLITEDTRFSNPIEAYRSMDLTSYHYSPFLYVNPQCEIQEDRIGLNSRLKVKDSFVVMQVKPIDQSSILPQSEDELIDLQPTFKNDMCKNV